MERMRQICRVALGLAAVLGVASCEVPADDPALGADPASALSPTDQAIAAQLYAGAPRTPAGFVADPAPASFTQVTTYHIKTRQLAAGAPAQHELCTDDWNEALGWSEQVAAAAPVYLDLVGNATTDRYYEFDRVPRGEPARYVRMRVYRCAYLDRAGVDLAAPAPFAGTLNLRPLDATALRESSEYLWLFTAYNNAGHAVVASESRTGPPLAHAITIASLEAAGVGSTCDRVRLTEWTHALDGVSGALTLTTTAVREFGVRHEAGAVVRC